MIEHFRPFIISFFIGFLIGIERERSHPKGTHPVGMRTFVLFALLGTFAAEIQSIGIATAIAAFVFGGILLGYIRTTMQRKQVEYVGLTTEMAAGLVFCLGYLTASKALLSAVLAATILLILISKERLHQFARQQIKRKELQAAVAIIIIGIGVLPFLPNHTVDPWELFNPRRFGWLILLLSIVQFGGYVAIRMFGNRFGTVLMGFFGGLVSSTAVFATVPQLSRQRPALLLPLAAASVFSVIGMLVELIIIIFAAAPALIFSLLLPILLMIIVGASSSLLLLRKHSQAAVAQPPGSPLDFKSVLRLALFIAAMLILSTVAGRYYGPAGIQYVTFFGALFELHGVSLATATLFIENKLTLGQASLVLLIAIAASYASKLILLWSFARNRYAIIVSLYLIVMMSAGAFGYWYLPHPSSPI